MNEPLYKVIADNEHRHWWFIGKNATLRSFIDRYAPTPDGRRPRALDVGCGPGGMLEQLAQRFDPIGVDKSEVALRLCEERGLNAVLGSLPDEMPFEPATFDLIVASEVLEHVERDAEAARTLIDLLAPGGTLVVTVPAFQWMWSEHDRAHHHFRRYTRARLLALFDSPDACVELASYYNTTFFPLMAAARVASKARPQRPVREIKPPPRPINAVMAAVFRGEGTLVQHLRLPFGGSLLAVIRRVGEPPVPSVSAPPAEHQYA